MQKSRGAQLNPGAKFCDSCGSEVHLPQNTAQPYSPVSLSFRAEKKRKTSPNKLLISAIAAILVIALGVIFLPGLFDLLSRGTAVCSDDIGETALCEQAVIISGAICLYKRT